MVIVVGNYWQDPATERKGHPLCDAVQRSDGQVAGVVALALDLKWLARHLAERGLTSSQSILIADRTGNIISRLPNPDALIGKNMRKSHEGIMDGNTTGWEEAPGVDGCTQDLWLRATCAAARRSVPERGHVEGRSVLGYRHRFAARHRADRMPAFWWR